MKSRDINTCGKETHTAGLLLNGENNGGRGDVWGMAQTCGWCLSLGTCVKSNFEERTSLVE